MFAFYRDTAQSCFHPTIFLIFFQKDEKKFKFYPLECFRILILRKISLNSVVHKVPFTALRLPENYSFTSSKLRIFGLQKPCK
jgi:hypothetical protein